MLVPPFTGTYAALLQPYIVSGSLYLLLVPVDAVPQLEYWQQVPGLVKDGCIFSYQQTSAFVAWVNEKRQGSVADAGLKRALAENEDGGEGATAYEEQKA